MLDGRDIIASLQHALEIYPSIDFIRWLVQEEEQEKRDLTEFVKALDLDSDYVLPILYRWQYEYKPLNDVWRELEGRKQGRENRWTLLRTQNSFYNQGRNWPQISFQLIAGTNIVWNAQEDIDDIMTLGRGFLRISLAELRRLQERQDLSPIFLENIRAIVSSTEEVINQLKALPILISQNAVKYIHHYTLFFC
jgi:hypothetical protein